MAVRKDVPNDPDRRSRIIGAALEVVTAHGVHRTTHRLIAQQASVPLGSVTYYFTTLDELLEAAFQLLVTRMSALYRSSLEAATSRSEAYEAVTDLICGDAYATPEQITALFEMYSYGNHNPVVFELCRDWMSISRTSLSLHLPEQAQRSVDVLVEGWSIQRIFDGVRPDRDLVLRTVTAVAEASMSAPTPSTTTTAGHD
jgi:DNA-binding transcriptional regulator YbjK